MKPISCEMPDAVAVRDRCHSAPAYVVDLDGAWRFLCLRHGAEAFKRKGGYVVSVEGERYMLTASDPAAGEG